MKKIILLSLFLIVGLVVSQVIPSLMPKDVFTGTKYVIDSMLYIALAFIMVNVGREFELDKTRLGSYAKDYMVAMATAAMPWIFIAVYFIMLMPAGYFGNWEAWKESLLLSRFAAPTSAGILFTMLAAAGLKNRWIYKKIEVLAIFDDLDTILLMIPLQILMIGMKWQLVVIVFVVLGLLWFGWVRLKHYDIKQDWKSLLIYSIILVFICQGLYIFTKKYFGVDSAIHIEVLLPAFVLGMAMKHGHKPSETDKKVSISVSYLFMLLVGLSAPYFIDMGSSASEVVSDKLTAQMPMMSMGTIAFHVIMVTLISNIGKLFPVFFYRDRPFLERLALSIGMFTRGEVGAGIIFIAIGYSLGGPLLIIALLSLVLNLVLTGFFVAIVKSLSLKVYKNMPEEEQ